MAQILWFENYQLADAPVLGGKNASLGALWAAGLPVPPGFAVSADCYRKALADGGLTGQLDALIAAVDPHDPASVAAAGARARALIGSLAASGDLALVAPLTAPSWAPVFGKIAATVTDVGGIMSHAAIVCREYGLPAVTGTAFGTKTIKTGQRLRVDGNAGTVTIIELFSLGVFFHADRRTER